MLIKLYLDDNFPIELPGGPQMCMWLVHDGLPLNHPKQAEALLKAAKLAPTLISELDLESLYFLQAGGVYVEDSSMTVAELGIKAGAMLRLTNVPPKQPSPSQGPGSPGSPRGGLASPRGMSMYSVQHQEGEEDDHDMDGATRMHLGDRGPAPSGSEDELYEARDEMGWFPFSVATDDYGESGVVFSNPDVEPKEHEAVPNTHQLCHTCADGVTAADSLRVAVTKHYKPMLMTTETVEGKVEKVGGARMPRWQNRYIVINEKSLNWYESEPKIGSKDKLKGSRAMWEGKKLLLVDVLDSPDPNKYPKVKDKVSMFHFGVVFIGSSRDQIHMIFRVGSAKEKANFVGFLQGIIKRAANHGASRDPVHWKRAANSFLLSLGDVGELSAANDQEEEALTDEIKILEEELQDLREEKPKVQAELEDEKAKVKLQSQDVENLNEQLKGLHQQSKDAEERVRKAKESYHQAEQEIAEEMKLKRMLEIRATKRRLECQDELDALLAEVESLKGYQNQLFGQWRKSEENHSSQERGASTDRHFSFSLDRSLMSAGQSMSRSRQESMDIQTWGSPAMNRNRAGSTQTAGRSGSVSSAHEARGGSPNPSSPTARNPRN